MNQTQTPVTLPELDARLRAYRARQAIDTVQRFQRRIILPDNTLQFASRALNDLIAALLISIAVGAAIDAAFDTWPWGITGMFVLGAAAAARNLYQTATRMAESEDADAGQPEPQTGPQTKTRGQP